MVGRWRRQTRSCLLGVHGVVLGVLGSVEVLVIVVLVLLHLFSLDAGKVDLSTTGATAALDDVGGVDLGKVVLVGVYSTSEVSGGALLLLRCLIAYLPSS